MKFELYIDSLVPHLASLRFDSNAKVFVDLMSDALVWSDEKVLVSLTEEEVGCLRAIFRYRTSLITNTPATRFEEVWNRLKNICPQWIGFDPARCMPSNDLIEIYFGSRS